MVAAVIPLVQVALRYIIIAAVQLGIWAAIEKYALPQINGAIQAIMQKFGVSEEQAKDIMSNDLLEFGEEIGIFAATMKSKMPLKLAELLGFTTKGWSKRALTAGVAKYLPFTASWIKVLPKGATIVSKEAAPAIIAGAVKSKTGFKIAYDLVMKTLGVGFVGTLAISNVIDFGNWNSGAYQKKMQKVIAFLSLGTLTPDADYRKSKTLSPEIFDKIYNTYKIEGAQYINDPYKQQHVVFTRDNMLDFLDVIGAELLRLDGSASVKEVNMAALPFIIFDVSAEAPTAQQEVAAAKTTPQVKVFTGVVAQGKLAEGVTFVARETDLIDDINELQRAAENNLASFIMALPGKIIYEIKIVSSVTSKDGFTQRGTTQKIITGYFTSGAPKYKTVTNKFAQLKIYVVTEKGTRTNIATVTLGPVNSAVFNPSGADIQLAEQEIKNNITTTDISEIKTIETTQQIAVEQTEKATAGTNTKTEQGYPISNSYAEALNNLIPPKFFYTQFGGPGWPAKIDVGFSPNVPFGTREITLSEAQQKIRDAGTGLIVDATKTMDEVWRGLGLTPGTWNDTTAKMLVLSGLAMATPKATDILNNIFPASKVVYAYRAPNGEILTNVTLETIRSLDTASGSEITEQPLASSNPNKCLAVTISDFFGGNIPQTATLEKRALLYESWGLGQAAYYTGTAEQNNRFLAELKRRSGC
jgi:hypothetical protein